MPSSAPPGGALAVAPLATALLAAAAALCLSATYAAAQVPPAEADQIAKLLEGQPPLTAEELQQQIDFTKAMVAGKPAMPPHADDHARRTYVSTKILSALLMINDPSLTPEQVAAQFGSPLAVATPEEVELVKSRQADLTGAALAPPR
jgi:hypothetical protein